MTHNDILRSVRYLLNVSDAKLGDIVRLGDGQVSPSDLLAFLRKEEEPGYLPCTEKVMAHFLNGLVTYKRGKDDTRAPLPAEVPVTNNTILKRLRVAFELKDSDIVAFLEKTGLRIAKTELSAFFRRPDHRNHRECGDQFLRNLLRGMTADAGASANFARPFEALQGERA